MTITVNDENVIPNQMLETSEEPSEVDRIKSSTQKRIDEITAEKHRAEERAQQQADQIMQLTASLAQSAAQRQEVQRPREPEFTVPEGIDPVQAKFFKDMMDANTAKLANHTQVLFQQTQQQMDKQNFVNKYATVPEVIRNRAAALHTQARQKYPDASEEDALKFAAGEAFLAGLNTNQRNQFNTATRPITAQGAPQEMAPTDTLTPPTQRADWDDLSNNQQIKLIEDYRKKGGKMIG